MALLAAAWAFSKQYRTRRPARPRQASGILGIYTYRSLLRIGKIREVHADGSRGFHVVSAEVLPVERHFRDRGDEHPSAAVRHGRQRSLLFGVMPDQFEGD